MRVDRDVSAEKYDREVAILHERAEELGSLGCYFARAAFPVIDVLVVPTRLLTLGVPIAVAVSPGGIVLPGPPERQQFQLQRLPWALTSMTFGVRFSLDDFDLRAPSVTFRHPTTWEILPYEQVPRGVLIVDGKDMPVVQKNHPATGAPFFCMRGVREYHEHPQHTGDEWLQYRGAINVFSTLTSIARCCCKNIAPSFVLRPPQLSVEWVL